MEYYYDINEIKKELDFKIEDEGIWAPLREIIEKLSTPIIVD